MAASLVGLVVIALLLVAMNRISGVNNGPEAPTAPEVIEEVSPLVAHWVADDWAGGTADWVDRISGYVAAAESEATAPARTDDVFGAVEVDAGIVFDGIDDVLIVERDQNPLQGVHRATIVALFEASDAASERVSGSWSNRPGPVQGSVPGVRNDWGLTYDSAGFAHGFFGNEVQISLATTLLDRRPHTMAMTWESTSVGGDGIARLYVDGTLIGITAPSEGGRIDNGEGFVIGSDAESILICCPGSESNRYFAGAVGEIQLYNTVMDPALLHAEIVGAAPITMTATDLRPNAATLNGLAYTSGGAADVFFRYGTDPALTTDTRTTAVQSSSGTAPISVEAVVDDLTPDSRYYFRLEIETERGVQIGRTRDLLLAPEIRIETAAGHALTDGEVGSTFLSATNVAAAPQAFTIINTGDFDLTDLAISITEGDADVFVVVQPEVTILEPGAMTAFEVRFTPPRVETFGATVEVSSNSGGEPFRVDFKGSGATVWTGPPITFTNPCATCASDQITENVAITRAESGGIFNAVTETESAGKQGLSPADTEWAFGTTAELGSLTYTPWFEWLGFKSPAAAVGQAAVLHLITDDIYIDIEFISWVDGKGGGGFSYARSTPDE